MQRVAIVTLGCARNDVDSDELADTLGAEGFALVEDAEQADVVVVNTCGFIASAKKDSIDTILAVAEGNAKVVVTGCLAERYGVELAESLPEAHAVLSFDDYPEIGDRLRRVLDGESLAAHEPSDRRLMLPITPVERAGASAPGHGVRRHRAPGPVASLKLASGCDRRCAFCAIPSFRGAFVSRRPSDILEEARLLAEDGVREIVLVSENSTSYGKDLGELRLLEQLLPELAQTPGIARVRVSYLQPAEMRPGLVAVMASTPGVAPYFDLSFQHASPTVLRRMRRFGGRDDFLALIDSIRRAAPEAGIRSNVIVGFPGETEEDLLILEDFLERAGLDAIGVFGYSDEEGTEAVGLPDHVPQEIVDERVSRVSSLADDLVLNRAEDRVGTTVEVLVEGYGDDGPWGRAAHQGPEDTITVLVGGSMEPGIGDIVTAVVHGTDGPDLLAERR